MHRLIPRTAALRLWVVLLATTCSSLAGIPASAQDSGEETALCPPYFRDLGPLGGESPQEVARQFLEGILEGDQSKVVSSFDLRSLESVGLAATYAELAKASALTRELETRIQDRFGEEAFHRIENRLGINFSGSGDFDSSEKLEELLAEMEVITEDDRSVALFSNPLDDSDPMRMQKIGERWYLAPPEEMGPENPGAGLAAIFVTTFLQASVSRLQQVEQALDESESREEFEKQLEQLSEEEGGLGLFSADESDQPRHRNAKLFYKRGRGTSGSGLHGGVAGIGASDGHSLHWSFVGRSDAGDVYVIEIETPEGKKEPEAILYSGGEKVLYESEDGDVRVWIEPSDPPQLSDEVRAEAVKPDVEVIKPETEAAKSAPDVEIVKPEHDED